MKRWSITRERITAFLSKYPAIISGIIIYSYLCVAIIRLFIKAKDYHLALSDAYDIFSALPFMWLLAVSLVKVIEYRSHLHKQEQALQIKNTQFETMREVIKGVQHQINNPLAVISLSIGQTKKAVADNPLAVSRVEFIEKAATQITVAMKKFSEAEKYEYEQVDQVGIIASLPKERQERKEPGQ